ncbi:MAG: alpha/beta hydrolase [Bacteroidetes bacterium]|nr:alpha/beta hydrolase [Bacteroidota bacterium]
MKIQNRLYVNFCFAALLVITGITTHAQVYTLSIRAKVIRSYEHTNDSIFIAGNFNEWNPGNPEYILIKTGDVYSITIPNLKEDVYQFKFTRGDWSKAEVSYTGDMIENHLVKLSSDSTLEYTIGAWQDDYPAKEKLHTASAHVSIIDTAFFMPQLNRTRRVWIYLPEGYAKAKNKKRYPVMYMHDGQNVFDNYTSGYGEWGVDECLDTLLANGEPPCIVVGIDCGPKRFNEYNPFYFEKFGEGEGDKYVAFLANTLKPFIDKHYRTLKDKDNTIIAGSSMGGLISYYAMLTYPNVFGKAGVFSPAFWTAPGIDQVTDSLASKTNGKIFFYMGELEGGTYVADMQRVADNIGRRSDAIIYTVIDPLSRHNEQAWRKWFAEFYRWTMGENFNKQVKLEK